MKKISAYDHGYGQRWLPLVVGMTVRTMRRPPAVPTIALTAADIDQPQEITNPMSVKVSA